MKNKKIYQIFLSVFMILLIFIIAGCGEQNKYNELKGQVTQMMQEANAPDKEALPAYMKSNERTKEIADKKIAYLTSDLKKYEDKQKPITEKLNEMQSLVNKDKELAPDFATFKKQIDEEKKQHIQVIREAISTVKLTGYPSPTPQTDPWAKYSKFD